MKLISPSDNIIDIIVPPHPNFYSISYLYVQVSISYIPHHILIIGGDHHNTLGVIRALGKEDANFSVLIHTSEQNRKNICCCHSKYVHEKYNIVADNENAIWNFFKNFKSDF